MTRAVKVSAGQIFCMLFVSRIVLMLTYSAGSMELTWGVDYLLVMLTYMAANFLTAIPIFVLCFRNPGMNVIECAQKAFGRGAIAVAVIYGLFFLYISARDVGRFNLFVTSVLNPHVPVFLFSLLVIVAACYAAGLGVEAVLRTSTVIAAILVLSLLFIIIALIPQLDLLGMDPIHVTSVSDFLRSAFRGISHTPEPLALLLLIPLAKGKVGKGFIIWNIVTAAVMLLLSFLVYGVLGIYTTQLAFPFYSAATVAELGIFQRMDAVFTAIWMGGAFIKTTFTLLLAVTCFQHVFGKKYKTLLIWLGGLIMVGASVLFSEDIQSALVKNFATAEGILVLVLMVVIPLILLIAGRKKGGVPARD